MPHAHGEGAKQAMSKRKLDNVLDASGNVRNDCGLANHPLRMARLHNQLALTASLAEIAKEAAAKKETNASLITSELIENMRRRRQPLQSSRKRRETWASSP